MTKTRDIFNNIVALNNLVATPQQLEALFEEINNDFFSVVSPLFDRRKTIELIEENSLEIIEYVTLSDDREMVRLNTREVIPRNYVQGYKDLAEYYISIQQQRNLGILKNAGVNEIEGGRELEKPNLEDRFLFLKNETII